MIRTNEPNFFKDVIVVLALLSLFVIADWTILVRRSTKQEEECITDFLMKNKDEPKYEKKFNGSEKFCYYYINYRMLYAKHTILSPFQNWTNENYVKCLSRKIDPNTTYFDDFLIQQHFYLTLNPNPNMEIFKDEIYNSMVMFSFQCASIEERIYRGVLNATREYVRSTILKPVINYCYKEEYQKYRILISDIDFSKIIYLPADKSYCENVIFNDFNTITKASIFEGDLFAAVSEKFRKCYIKYFDYHLMLDKLLAIAIASGWETTEEQIEKEKAHYLRKFKLLEKSVFKYCI